MRRVGWRWKTRGICFGGVLKYRKFGQYRGLVRDLNTGRIGLFMDLLWLLKFQLKLEAESLALVAVIA